MKCQCEAGRDGGRSPREEKRRLEELLEQNPGIMVAQMADRLGIAESEVIALLPSGMSNPAPVEDFAEIWQEMTGWEKITFIAVNEGAVMEVGGRLPGGTFGHGMFNLKSGPDAPLGGHLLVGKLGSIWFLSKPHFGRESHSVQFFSTAGRQMFAVYVGRGTDRKLLPEVQERYLALRARYGGTINNEKEVE